MRALSSEHDQAPAEADRSAVLAGRVVFGVAAATLMAISLPVLVAGAPLADDFNNCLSPHERGLPDFLESSFDRLGLIRPARFVEILLTNGVCERLPFGVAIAVGLALTFAIALLLRRLVTLLGADAPWPDVAAAIWLLQPLGLEAALWPAALHVPVGLTAALGSLIAIRRGRVWLGAGLGLIAMLSVEQAILALPLAAWLVAPRPRRRLAALAMAVTAGVVAVSYLLVPGNDPRLAAGAAARVQGLVSDLGFLVQYPAVGLGAESIPLALRWAFPLSLAVLCLGVAAGWLFGARAWQPPAGSDRPWTWRQVAAVVLLLLLVNGPVLLSSPRQGSPRVFTPTWLVLAAVVPLALSRIRIQQTAVVGALGGLYLGGAVLSLALSAWVRIETGAVVEQVAREVASRTTDGEVVVLCDVPRAAVSPAPRGAYAVQDFLFDWSAADAVRYYTGRPLTFQIHPAGSAEPCRPADGTLTMPFAELVARDG